MISRFLAAAALVLLGSALAAQAARVVPEEQQKSRLLLQARPKALNCTKVNAHAANAGTKGSPAPATANWCARLVPVATSYGVMAYLKHAVRSDQQQRFHVTQEDVVHLLQATSGDLPAAAAAASLLPAWHCKRCSNSCCTLALPIGDVQRWLGNQFLLVLFLLSSSSSLPTPSS